MKGTIGEELLKEHVSYGPLVQKLLKRFNFNIQNSKFKTARSRRSPTSPAAVSWTTSRACCRRSLDVVIRKGSWDMLPIFQIIAAKERRAGRRNLYQVFNMGIGMVAIVSADKADAVLKFIRAQKHKAWLIGEVVKGKGEARVV